MRAGTVNLVICIMSTLENIVKICIPYHKNSVDPIAALSDFGLSGCVIQNSKYIYEIESVCKVYL